MNRNVTMSTLLLALLAVGCGGGSWKPPAPAPRLPSIPVRVLAEPRLLQSLRLSIVRVAAQPETDEEAREQVEEAREAAKEHPSAPIPETELAGNWRAGFSQAFARHRVQVMRQGGTLLDIDVRRARGRNFVCDVTVRPFPGYAWKKRYLVDAKEDEPNVELGPALVVNDLISDPEFLAAAQGQALPLGTGKFLGATPPIASSENEDQARAAALLAVLIDQNRIAQSQQKAASPSAPAKQEPAASPASTPSILGWVSLGLGLGVAVTCN